jgi:hypothetical protein
MTAAALLEQLLPAAGVLLGVLTTGAVTNRQERRRWEREDRHRHDDDRRTAYLALLAAVYAVRDSRAELDFEFQQIVAAEEAMDAASPDDDDARAAAAGMARRSRDRLEGIQTRFAETHRRMLDAMPLLYLVGTPAVMKAMDPVTRCFLEAAPTEETSDALTALTDAMAHDLGVRRPRRK